MIQNSVSVVFCTFLTRQHCAVNRYVLKAETWLLTQKDVASLLTLDECIVAVEHAFKLHAEGKVLPPTVCNHR